MLSAPPAREVSLIARGARFLQSLVLTALLLLHAGAPLLSAEAEAEPEDPVSTPEMSEPLAWYPATDGTATTEPGTGSVMLLKPDSTTTWRLEPASVDATFSPAPWNFSFELTEPFIGSLDLALFVEGAEGMRAVSLVTTITEADCASMVCHTSLAFESGFVVLKGENLALVASYLDADLDGAAPQAAPPPAPMARAKTNRGTMKVHDDAVARPDTRNEPHVSCEFWVEGFDLASDSGVLQFEWWSPTGDKRPVLARGASPAWRADGEGTGSHHFLAGPYRLPAGHYRLEAYAEPGHPGGKGHFAKAKMFWVDECTEPSPMRMVVGTAGTSLVSARMIPALPTPEAGTLVLVGLGGLLLLGFTTRRR